jgi:CubicO group peptidase (beta-lactamase class C family)
MGIMQEKYSLDINEKVSTYLGPGWSKAPKAKEDLITVKHLLTMTSGLDYELNYLEDAGTLWYYSNAAYEVLFKLYEKLASSNVVDFSTENLFSKIGMTNSLWNGAQLSSNARDLARFGLMILAKGKWEENSLTNNKVYFDDMLATSQPLQEAYGYLWWLNGKPTYYDEHTIFNGPIYPAMPTDALLAMGRHDQRIEIIPSLDLVVVRQGDATLLPELGEESFDNQFWTLLLQAIKNNA